MHLGSKLWQKIIVSENIYMFQSAHFSPQWTVVWEMRSHYFKWHKPHSSRTLLSWKLVFFHIHLSTEDRTLLLKSYSLSAFKLEAKECLLKCNPHWFYAQQARGQQEFCWVCTFTNETVAVDFQKNISTNMPSYKANHCIGVPRVWQVKCWQIHSQEHSHNYSVNTR